MYPRLANCSNPRFNDPKPDFPYTVGKRLRIRPHMPPPPVQGWLDDAVELKHKDFREREYVDPAQRCLIHPPSAGEFMPGVAELEIVGHVRAGDEHNGQLLIVRVLNSTLDLPSNIELLAKLYDPLYFDHKQDDADPFRYVDSAYIQESGVYRRLADVQGSIIPKYYGSFSLSLPVREVRLILMENVPGTSMDNLNPSNFSQPERQAIMKAIIDSDTVLYTNNIKHRDIHPRNILLLPKPSDQARKVVIVDFGQSRTFRTPFPEWEAEFLPGVPISPLLRWIKPDEDFNEWVDWDWKAWVEREYEHTRGSITEYMQSTWGPTVECV